MQRVSVSSSDLRSVGFDAQTHTLEIEFLSGGLYQYDGVPSKVYEGLMAAPSLGRYFRAYIKDAYPCRRIR